MCARIALFRACEDAAGTARRLRRLGFSVVRLPVMAIVPHAIAPAKTRYDAVVATSAKAFLSEAPVDRAAPLFVVGAKTAREAEARGWRLGAPPAPDADRLIATLERLTAPGAEVLYLAGRDRKGALEAALRASRSLEIVEAYAAEARIEWRPAEARKLISCEAALHYSARSAALAARLADAGGLSECFAQIAHFCLSRGVADALNSAGAGNVFVSDAPDETAMLATLSRAARIFPSNRPSRI